MSFSQSIVVVMLKQGFSIFNTTDKLIMNIDFAIFIPMTVPGMES